MTPQDSRPASEPTPPSADPWQAFSYIVTGVLVYGLLGFAADRWLGTSGLTILGITIGAGLGIYLVIKKFGAPPPDDSQEKT